MKILILDNYDSFTYNLVQMTEQIIGKNVFVAKNDEIALQEVDKFDKIVLSPGPGIPAEAGILLEIIKKFAGKKPIFGVCLGLQAIAEAFGASLINLDKIYHGVATEVEILNKNAVIFRGFPDKFQAGRYHSWAANPENFPEEIEITAIDEEGMIMAVQHRKYDLHAVQFHPESILTPLGKDVLKNFLLH
ncbi:anthranilate synthase component II [Chryseobacterium sp.]|uniref:anthranilate synthase component II n=1 Tax=Chryseobacterium sp. TaxID=1871047 RepID=UPI0011CA6BC3|nr:aminodeoxychorismate/anthranilate synthase component II [Chryseobacterium sp.]TXF79124.1 aminodeoxychorismate/anthranilate synthase component II [Chryseobacterium sp.]